MGKAAERVWSLLFPNRCVLCGALLPPAQPVCAVCLDKLLPVGRDELDALARHIGCDGVTAPYQYTGALRAALHRFKFRNRPAAYRGFARLIVQRLPNIPFDCVTFAPMVGKRQRDRGYNQAELLAKGLASLLGAPCRKLLVKRADKPAQHTLSAEERARNAADAYTLRYPVDLTGRNVLLVDDVITTGSTAAALTGCLRSAGAVTVHCAALAHPSKAYRNE